MKTIISKCNFPQCIELESADNEIFKTQEENMTISGLHPVSVECAVSNLDLVKF